MSRKRSNSNSSSEATRIRQFRSQQLNQLSEVITATEEQLKEASKEYSDKLSLLESVSLGLYEEVDKLSKKSPGMPITDLVLSQLNDIIRETKQLANDDPYVKRLNEFVSAGDNPEQRDAVVMLRQVRQGLERHKQQLSSLISKLKGRLNKAKAIDFALRILLEENVNIEKNKLEKYGHHLDDLWFTDEYPYYFNSRRLDAIDFSSYFA
jgi:hypothetical protein